MVDFSDPNGMESESGLISKGIDGCDDGIDLRQLSKDVVIFDCDREDDFLIIK